ncbi:MAG: hypothetical protein L6R36_009100 [Xanthoria steineri]|nr:MAG: hypothetical protein L6R36_009100 [Xanthoria steineri]
MEPVGVAASIVQLINVTAKTIKYLNSVKDASEDRSRLLQETTSLLPLFISLQGKVETAKNHQSVEWLRHVRDVAVESGPFDQLRSALELLAKRLKPKHGLKGVAYAFVWTLHRDESEALLARIERVKSTINLALHGDTFALAQSIKADTDETRQDISTLTRDVANIQIREDLQQRQGILQWLSPLNFFSTQQDILARREKGTGQWLIDSTEFKNWLAGNSSTRCCPGIPGAGKSVLASVVIDFLRERHKGQDSVGVAGVYCNFKERDSQSPENLLAACYAQLAPQTLPQTMIDLHRTHRTENTRPNRQEIFGALEHCITQLRTAYLVVDAVDECSEDVRNTLMKCFRSLPEQIRLLVTTRHIDEILLNFRDSPRVEIRANPDDLKKYVASRIESNRRLESHVRNHASLLQDICDKVTAKADGMFLAAKLHVDSLSTKTSIKKLKSALENLSTNLNVLYDEAILRIEKQPPDYHILAEKALRWVAYTYRPLKVKALQAALAIDLEDLDFDIEAIQPIGLILDVCAGLLVFNEENKMVRLVHYTAQDYFDNLGSSKFDDAHVLIAKECLVYLNYGIFQNSQAFTDDKESGMADAASDSLNEQDLFNLLGYASAFWAQHAMTKRDSTLDLPEVHQFLARHPRVFLQTPDRYDDDPYNSYPSPFDIYSDIKSHHGCEIAAFYGLNDELEMFCEEVEGA